MANWNDGHDDGGYLVTRDYLDSFRACAAWVIASVVFLVAMLYLAAGGVK